MNFKEKNLRVFQKKPISSILFQPRIEPWFHWHKIFNKLPKGYKFDDVTELFDHLNLSMRYVHYYTGMPDPVVRVFNPEVKIQYKTDEMESTTIYQTPFGNLTEKQHLTIDQTWRTVKFAVRDAADLHALKWLYENTEYHFDISAFQKGKEFMRDRGEPQFWVPKSPYQALAQIWMKLTDLVYAIIDHPQLVEDLMGVIDESYDPLFKEICSSGMVNILNFGENIHEQLLSPHYFERFLLPYWDKRAGQLHKAGIFCHVHIDGYFKHMLPYIKSMPFDGIEALTPEPQGDMSIETIKDHIGDKILIDGIPAVLFLETYSREQLLATTEKLILNFYPNIILGISDELPQGAGIEAIERVRLVAEICSDTMFPN